MARQPTVTPPHDQDHNVNVEFDWQVGTETEQLETLAKVRRRRWRRWPWWAWVIVASVVIATAAGGYVFLRRRYVEAQQRLAFQIQNVIDLEAKAYARQDRDLFLEQQDADAEAWYTRQAERVGQDCPQPDEDMAASAAPGSRCLPVLPAKIETIDLQGDVAWVEVIEGQSLVRRARFYRQTEQGWVHTAPRAGFWGAAIELRYGDMVFLYHRRDQPYVDPLVEQIADAVNHVCATLGCTIPEGADREELLRVDFSVHASPGEPLRIKDGALTLPSPWLTGISLDGTSSQAYLNELTYAVTHEMTARYLRALTGKELGELQAAVAHEYAAWRSEQNTARAPILGRLVERNGEDALPAVLRSLDQIRTLNLLMVQWMRLSAAEQPESYFQTLLAIEHEALWAGRRETFLYLQDDSAEEWLASREALFETIQATEPQLTPLQVQAVSVSGDLARVTVDPPTQSRSPSLEVTVFFRRRNGDWKHTPPPGTQGQARTPLVAVALVDHTEHVQAVTSSHGLPSASAYLTRSSGKAQ